MFPLSAVLFPGGTIPLHVFEDRYRALMADCVVDDRRFGIVLVLRGSEVGGGDERAAVGTLARIEQAGRFDDGRWMVVVRGESRFRVKEWLEESPYPLARVEVLPDAPPGAASLDGAARAVERLGALASEIGQGPGTTHPPATSLEDAERVTLGWEMCSELAVNPFDLQSLLEVDDSDARMRLLASLAKSLGDDLARLLAEGN